MPPGRTAVSIVIPVWNAWAMTEACLASLEPTLRPGDQVVVVDNGSRDDTPAELARRAWLTVLTNPTNRGFAAACNQGAAVAAAPIVVFLNNDTRLPDDWLDGLLAPFADPSVVATGPLSNCASGAQHVATADYGPASFGAFAAAWRREHRRQSTETTRLVGMCLAVRARALRAVGGWDEGFAVGGAEDDDLCLRLVAAGGRLVICHETFVHHHGHATFDTNGVDWFAVQQRNVDRLVAKHTGRSPARRRGDGPLLSACLIVKNEADVLADCLRALHGLADEIVVYDTGSDDGSPALARAVGAIVVQGEWHDDFARARNAALACCRGEWVLSVDADEVFDGDPAALRATLETPPVDAFALEIRNRGGDGQPDAAHRACRVFRRAHFRWQGRLHEQVVHRRAGADFPLAVLDGGRLIHSGYTPERMRRKGKAERNLRLATLDAAAGGDRDPGDALVNLACSYVLAGRDEEALALFVQARALAAAAPARRRRICRAAAELCLSRGQPEAALVWIDDLAGASASQALVRYLRGRVCVAQRRWRDALDAYAGVAEVRDEDGVMLSVAVVRRDRAHCHFMLEEWAAALDAVAGHAGDVAGDDPIWPILAECCQRTGRDLALLLDALPDARLAPVFARLLSLDAGLAPEILERLAEHPRYRVHALALALRLAPAMAPVAAARWSVRLRAIGLTVPNSAPPAGGACDGTARILALNPARAPEKD